MKPRITRSAARSTASPVYTHIVRWTILGLTFFLPIFFLPWNSDVLEMNKMGLLYAGMTIAVGAWLLGAIMNSEGRMSWRLSVPDWLLVIFFAASALAMSVSVYHYRSLFGATGHGAESFLGTVAFLVLYLLVRQHRDLQPKLLGALLLSGAIVLLFNFLQVFNWFLLPWGFAKNVTFGLVSAVQGPVTIYFVLIGLLSFITMMRMRGGILRILVGAQAILAFFLLLVYDQPVAWYALLAGMVLILVAMLTTNRQARPQWILAPSLVIALAVLSLFMNVQQLFQANISPEVSLPTRTGIAIALQSTLHRPIGYGQGTYDGVFAQLRPKQFATSPLWNVQFVQSSNEWLQLTSTIGVFGALGLLIVFCWMLWATLRQIWNAPAQDDAWWAHVLLGVTGVVLFVAALFMTLNAVLVFVLWLVLAVGLPASTQRTSLKNSDSMPLYAVGFSLFLIGAVVVWYFGGRFWVADMRIAQAAQLVAAQKPLTDVQAKITTAIALNDHDQAQYFSLADNLMVQAQVAAQAEKPDATVISNLLLASAAAARTGVARYPFAGASYEALARTLRTLDQLNGVPGDATTTALQQAAEHEPNNPGAWTALGQQYIGVAQFQQSIVESKDATQEKKDAATSAATTALSSARAAYAKAEALSPNFSDAILGHALALRMEGKGADAVQVVEAAALRSPNNTNILFGLAELYRLDKRTDDAVAVLKRVVSLFPGHSDAHYRLAQIYEDRKDTANALAEYQIVLQLNPTNSDVKKKVDALKK